MSTYCWYYFRGALPEDLCDNYHWYSVCYHQCSYVLRDLLESFQRILFTRNHPVVPPGFWAFDPYSIRLRDGGEPRPADINQTVRALFIKVAADQSSETKLHRKISASSQSLAKYLNFSGRNLIENFIYVEI